MEHFTWCNKRNHFLPECKLKKEALDFSCNLDSQSNCKSVTNRDGVQ